MRTTLALASILVVSAGCEIIAGIEDLRFTPDAGVDRSLPGDEPQPHGGDADAQAGPLCVVFQQHMDDCDAGERDLCSDKDNCGTCGAKCQGVDEGCWRGVCVAREWPYWLEHPTDTADRYEVVDGGVRDYKTGLTWEAHDDDAGSRNRDQYCQFRGSGWRLPTYAEAYSLVSRDDAGPASDPRILPLDAGAGASSLWTSTAVLEGGVSFFYTVDLRTGVTAGECCNGAARCVR